MMDDIKNITLDYEICKNVDIDEARLLLVKYAEELLLSINLNEKARPYLHDYPFTYKNIKFSLTFVQPDMSFTQKPNITYVTINTSRDHRVDYCTFDQNARKLRTAYKEPYPEALRIYQETLMRNEAFEDHGINPL